MVQLCIFCSDTLWISYLFVSCFVVSTCNCIFSHPLGAISFRVCTFCGDIYIGHWPTGDSWYRSPTASTHISPQLPSFVPFNVHIVWFIDWNCLNPTMLISSVIDNSMCSNFNCIWVLFYQLGFDLKLSCNRKTEWIVDPPIWNAADPVGAFMRTIGWSSSGFYCVFEKIGHISLYETYNVTFPCPPLDHSKKVLYPSCFSPCLCAFM